MSELGAPSRSTPAPAAARAGAVAPAAAHANVSLGVVTNLPASLEDTAAGAIIKGTVVGRDSQGHMLVRTSSGMLTLRTALALPNGSQVALQVRTLGTRVQVAILSVDGKPVTTAPSAPLFSPPPSPGDGAPAKPLLASTTVSGRVATALSSAAAAVPEPVLIATVVSPHGRDTPSAYTPRATLAADPPAAASGTTADRFTVGEHLYVRIVVSPPPPAPTSASGAAVSPTPSPAATSEPSAAPSPASPASAANPPAPRLLSGMNIQGTVASAQIGGSTVVVTEKGLLRVNGLSSSTPGQTVQVQILGPVLGIPSAAANVTVTGNPAFAMNLVGDWPTLREVAAAVALETLPLAAPSPTVAQPGPRLAASVAFLVAALRSGDFSGWLDTDVRTALERAGRHDLLQRLGDDFRQMARLVNEAPPSEWRPMLISVYDGGVLGFVRFLYRHRHGGSGTNVEASPGTDFVIGLSLSQLGELQIQGHAERRRLDLFILSRRELPEWVQNDIRTIVAEAGEASGLVGAVAFRVVPAFDEPLKSSPPDQGVHVGLVV